MVRRKGQDTLIRAWPEVLRSHPGARLLLVGDGPDRSRLERLADRVDVREAVVFTGSVPWEEVPAYIDAGDVFAMPCRTRLFGLEPEAWGIVFLEAQACGLPVVVGRSGGAPETVIPVGGGWCREWPRRRPPWLGSCAADGAASAVPLGRGRGDVVAPRRSGPRRPVGGVTGC